MSYIFLGLGEGMLDSKATTSKFWITLEDIHNNEGKSEVPNLSQLSHSLSTTLLYPPVTVASSGNEDRPVATFMSFLKEPLDCDLHLVNLRTLPDSHNFTIPSHSSLLILHRKGSTCSINGAKFCHAESKGKSFQNVQTESIHEASITGLETKKRLHDLSEINVPLMEIGVFNVTFTK